LNHLSSPYVFCSIRSPYDLFRASTNTSLSSPHTSSYARKFVGSLQISRQPRRIAALWRSHSNPIPTAATLPDQPQTISCTIRCVSHRRQLRKRTSGLARIHELTNSRTRVRSAMMYKARLRSETPKDLRRPRSSDGPGNICTASFA
jgi:hypothetical protein